MRSFCSMPVGRGNVSLHGHAAQAVAFVSDFRYTPERCVDYILRRYLQTKQAGKPKEGMR